MQKLLRLWITLELCRGFLNEGASVAAFDPVVKALPVQLKEVSLANTALDAVREADALVVATEWPEFRQIRAEDILSRMRNPLIVDPARFLSQQFTDARAAYATIGASL